MTSTCWALVVDASVRPAPAIGTCSTCSRTSRHPRSRAEQVDLVAKPKLLPILEDYRKAHPFVEFVPASAADGTNVEVLEGLFLQYLPEGEPLYPPDYLTDQTDRFFVAEVVREQVLRLTHDELPFSTAVIVDRFEESDEDGVRRLYCTILVERDSQKPIVVGKAGSMIKEIGTAARAELEHFFQKRVFLDLHVKVKSEWRDDERMLNEIGRSATRC